jgi:protein-tyrosine phosphatase
MTDFERVWALDGVENFRDYGGYPTASGRRVTTGWLYRSAHHAGATDADLARIDAVAIHTLVDLRRATERSRMPNLQGPGWQGEVIANDLGDQPVDSFHTHLETSDQSVEAMHDYLRDSYRHVAFEPRHIDLYSRYFRALAEGEGPVLIHCAAGKDRTGLLAALTHRLLGVSEDDLMADYLLTNNRERMARRAPLFAAWAHQLTGRTPSEEAIFASMGVEAEYLHIAFDAIEAQYGSIEHYLEEALGVDERLKARIEAQLLE